MTEYFSFNIPKDIFPQFVVDAYDVAAQACSDIKEELSPGMQKLSNALTPTHAKFVMAMPYVEMTMGLFCVAKVMTDISKGKAKLISTVFNSALGLAMLTQGIVLAFPATAAPGAASATTPTDIPFEGVNA